jgi:hypothetical protein
MRELIKHDGENFIVRNVRTSRIVLLVMFGIN